MRTVKASRADHLRRVADVLEEQQTLTVATIDRARADLSDLQKKLDGLVASTAIRHQRRAKWHRDTAVKIELLVARRRVASAISTQRRGLSSSYYTCDEPSTSHLLVVDGVCSCTGGLLVEGRNVTKELDAFQMVSRDSSTAVTTSTTEVSTTKEWACINYTYHPKVVGTIADSTDMNGPRALVA